jgi:hypothetical protein
MTPKAFESRLQALVDESYGVAAPDDNPYVLAREALERLTENPSLRVYATPRGPSFYEDPLLDAAWSFMNAAADSRVGFAAEGEDLDYKFTRWLPVGLELLRARFARNWDVLKDRTPTKDVPLKLPAHIAIFGDGGYRGLAQQRVFKMIQRRAQEVEFSVLIHLGDTYHGGGEGEMLRHLVTPLSTLGRRLGRIPTFTLCGNHDVYAGPDGYLSALSVLDQPGRFFSIETAVWRLACLDSTLGDASLRHMNGKIDEEQLRWLTSKQGDDRKHLIALTHHIPRSAWESSSGELMSQLQGMPGLLAWYWGHEHRLAAYEPSDAIHFAGGCVGNGAFLEPWTEPKRRDQGLAWYPQNGRCTCFRRGGRRSWPHGYLELELKEDSYTERFYLEREEGDDSSDPAFTRTVAA